MTRVSQSDFVIAHAVTLTPAVCVLVKTTRPVTSMRSPCRAGALKVKVSIDMVTNSRWANFEQAIPAVSYTHLTLPTILLV